MMTVRRHSPARPTATPPRPRYRNRSQQAVIALLRVTDRLRRELAAVVEPHGVTGQQFNVLRILRGAGGEGLPTLEIGERMIEQAPGVTRLLDRLERKGWVERRRCPIDRRRVLCRITDAGLAMLAGLDEPVARFDDRSLLALSPREQAALVDLLERLDGAPASGAPHRPSTGREAVSPKRRTEK
jgi:DNA-binding MarR family transcriptional regulator